jgi:hypothetical protein
MVVTTVARLSATNFKNSGWYDKFWKKRQIFIHTAVSTLALKGLRHVTDLRCL